MTSHRTFVLLLLVLGVVSAFNISDYLYPTEANVSVAYANFTLDGTPYSIVSINGADSFLLRGNDIISDKGEIESVLQSYYSTYFFPSKSELDNLENLVIAYNDSRNDGQKFKGKEEYICRSSIFIDGRVKWNTQPVTCRNESDAELCKMAANLMYQYLSSSTGTPPVSSPNDLLPHIRQFGFASYGIDTILSSSLDKLHAAESDPMKMSDALAYMKGNMTSLSLYESQIEDSLFTLTKNKTTDVNHWGLCPDMVLNRTILTQINATVMNLSAKMAPYDNRVSVSANISDSTAARLDQLKSMNMAKYYADLFTPINASGAAAIIDAQTALKHVHSDILSSKLEKLTSLQSTIPEDISNKNFTTLETDISEYKNLTSEVNLLSTSATEAYGNARNAKNSANAILLILETKDSDPMTMKSLSILINETEDVNAQFRDGLSASELEALSSNYSSVEARAKTLMDGERQMPATKVLLMFRGFARKVNTGLARVASRTDVIAPQDIPRGVVPLGAFSALVLLSFASIALVVFLYVFSAFRFSVPKTGHIIGAAFLCALLALISFTVFMYLFLGKTSTDANLQEFLLDFNSRNDTAILVDLSNVSSLSDAHSMQACASVLADSMAQRNKTWTMYTMTPNTCTRMAESGTNSSLAVSDCKNIGINASSSFVLSYSQKNEVPKFAIIYQSKAQIKGNQDYYDSCPIVALFS